MPRNGTSQMLDITSMAFRKGRVNHTSRHALLNSEPVYMLAHLMVPAVRIICQEWPTGHLLEVGRR